ncbi:WYL domain-containing protein [Candidatus Oscillochloris fontis]|uniref:WYL domain-containing protein n=1 Tax=Candidatus Oscillochloris fontis TaxID=2496868 RepID=UPI00101D069B|nr:WYL domain-containing protein [Candidatus Oscillochloris fontis]
MNHWARMLADLPGIAQQTIARYQRISLPHQCSAEERVLRLRQALCRQATVRAVYQSLAADEQAALHVLRDLHAGMRPAALALRFGPLRSWSQLAKDPVARSISERLVLLGWLLPRPATPHHPERLLLPPELRRWLPQPLVIPRVAPAPHTPCLPPLIITASALLLASARQPLPLRADGHLRQSALREFACLSDLSADLAGLLHTTLELLCGLGLLTRYAGVASPTPGVGGFLALPLDQRLERLRSAWVALDTPDHWLARLDMATNGIVWPILRRRLIAWVEALPVGSLIAPEAIYPALRAALGPLADAQTHGLRRVRRSPWSEQRAAAVWQANLQGMLHWLGYVAWPDTQHCLRPLALPAEESAWRYGSPMHLWVPYGTTERDLLALAPALVLVEQQADAALYRIAPQGVARAVAQRHAELPLRMIVQRHAGPEPAGWMPSDCWNPAPIRVAPQIVVESPDPTVLEQAARQRTVRRLLARRLAPGLALVAPTDVAPLVRALQRQGLAVESDVATEAPQTAHGTDFAPGVRATLLVAAAFLRRYGPPDLAMPPPEQLERVLRQSLPPALRQATDATLRDLVRQPLGEDDSQPWNPQPDAGDDATSLRAQLRAAIAAKRMLTIRYHDAEQNVTTRQIRPLDLYFQGEHWYLQAHCALVDDLRTFRVDRIILASGKL